MLDEYIWKCDKFSVGDVWDDTPMSMSTTMYLSTKFTIKTHFKAFFFYLKKPSLSTSWKIDSILYWAITLLWYHWRDNAIGLFKVTYLLKPIFL